MAKRKVNQGRHYEAEDWVAFVAEGTIESEGYSIRDIDAYDVQEDPKLQKVVAAYTRDVEKAMSAWLDKHPGKSWPEDVAYNVYMSLIGSGTGMVDAWDEKYGSSGFYTKAELDDLKKYMEKKVSKYADFAGGGKLNDALSEAVWRAADEKGLTREENKGRGMSMARKEYGEEVFERESVRERKPKTRRRNKKHEILVVNPSTDIRKLKSFLSR